jgi:hypothetical protein
MTTLTTPAPRTRAPLTVRAACVLLALLVTASMFGLVMFTVVWTDDAFGPGLVFAAVALAAAATAVASIPALLRGDRTGWLVVLGWTVTFDYWTVYKIFGLPEYESWPFLVVGLTVLALLAAPATRRSLTSGGAR